jgi:diadenosine tetraphosphate (Ap4A) HIT family hydrolase
VTGCRFCLGEGLLADRPIHRNGSFLVLGRHDRLSPEAAIIVPLRHVLTPFEIGAAEWGDMADALAVAQAHLADLSPDGFTVGWNVGEVAGQEIMHAHLHVIARFAGRAGAGRGVHAAWADR